MCSEPFHLDPHYFGKLFRFAKEPVLPKQKKKREEKKKKKRKNKVTFRRHSAELDKVLIEERLIL